MQSYDVTFSTLTDGKQVKQIHYYGKDKKKILLL